MAPGDSYVSVNLGIIVKAMAWCQTWGNSDYLFGSIRTNVPELLMKKKIIKKNKKEKEKALENVICEVVGILPRSECVNIFYLHWNC